MISSFSLLRSRTPRMINLLPVCRSACKPLLPGISPGVSASLVRSISVLASLPRRPYPLQPVIRFSRFCACLQEPVYLGVLRSDPRPSYQHDPERLYGLSVGGVEVKFKVDGDVLTVVSTGKLKKNK